MPTLAAERKQEIKTEKRKKSCRRVGRESHNVDRLGIGYIKYFCIIPTYMNM
jgi:hypothetical protein